MRAGAVLGAGDLLVVLVEDEDAGGPLLGARRGDEFVARQLEGDTVVGLDGRVGAALRLLPAGQVGGVEDVHLARAVGDQNRLAAVPFAMLRAPGVGGGRTRELGLLRVCLP